MHPTPDPRAEERDMLEQFLDFHRETLVQKCEDLSGEQVASRPLVSGLSLQGLVRHLTQVERWWFRMAMCDMPLHAIYPGRDADFDDVEPQRWTDDLQRYVEEVAAARDAVVYLPLDTVAKRGEPVTLRWVYLHMIAEYARHNGHADLLREAIDGRTG